MYNFLQIDSISIWTYWLVYGVLTGILLTIALYLICSPRPAFSNESYNASFRIRKSAGWLIAIVSVQFLVAFVLSSISEVAWMGGAVGQMSTWGDSCMQQLMVLMFLPLLCVFLNDLLQGMSRIRQYHIIWLTIFPVFLLIWTITHGLIHRDAESAHLSWNLLLIARVYWSIAVVLMLYVYIKSLRRYHLQLKELFSEISSREVTWLYTLALMNVVYVGWFYLAYACGWSVVMSSLVQHIMALMLALYTVYHVDHQQLIDWTAGKKMVVPLEPDMLDNRIISDLHKRVEKVVEEQIYLNPDLTRDDLVEALKTNRTYLNMYFAARHLTFYTFVNNYRVEYALTMMQDSVNPHTLKEVALSCGYKSLEVFSRQFKSIKGYSPSQYFSSTRKKK